MQRTEILNCSCSHEEQDKLYGKGRRVHNVNSKGQAACTVCCPSRRRNKNTTLISPSPLFGHGLIPAMPPRNLKNVPI